jgi:uncharacterized protein (TIGR03435 family)
MIPKRTNHNCKKLLMSVAAFVAIVAQSAFGQVNATAPQAQDAAPRDLPRFDVATIKPIDTRPGVMHRAGADVYPGGRIIFPTVSLKSLISTAFDLPYSQLSGGEEWMDKDYYDVEAKAPEGSTPYDLRHTWFRLEDPRLRQMLQALLIDRFQLKVHRETKTGQVYILVKSGKTIRIKPTDAPSAKDPGASEGFGSIGNAGDTWDIHNASMRQLANFVSDLYMHRPVFDQTGLPGSYDFKWKMLLTDPDQPDPLLGSKDELMQFIQVMGLKLTPSTGPVETLVIDHAGHPSPN